MKRISGLLLVASLFVPAAASAQKPSDSKETRSADVYMKNAEESTLTSEKKELYQQAIAVALEGLANNPNNPKPWFQIGKAYHKIGDFIGADTAFAKAEAMYPGYAKEIGQERQEMWVGVFNSAVAKIRANETPAGIELLRLAARLNPTNPLAYQSLGSIFLQMGDTKNAEEAYRAELAILQSPTRPKLDEKKQAEWADMELNAVRALATMLGQTDRYAEAEVLYRDLLKRDPENPAIMSNLAITLTRAKKTSEANAIYSQLLSRTDLTGNQLLNVGIGLHNAQEYEKAADAFARASQVNPTSYDVMDFEVNSRSGVVDALSSSIQGKTGAAAAPIREQLMAQYAKIIATATRGLDLSPADATMIMRLAAAQRGMSDFDSSKKDEWQRKVLQTLERNNALTYSISEIQTISDEKTITLNGTITGLGDKAGTKARLKFHLVDKDGKSVASKDAEIDVPAKDDRKPFSVVIDAPATAVSWKYEMMK